MTPEFSSTIFFLLYNFSEGKKNNEYIRLLENLL